ncbi:MAG: polyphosphate kinase, partial [Rhodospirillales bacterium]|nr:polyphosphate kinase [Rhodospirillales bacterium]
VVEGWDAAGKGGMIRRLVEPLDPRGVKVWSIGPPDAHEEGRHYLHRFWAKLPAPGTLAIFDRSWYGRVLVERVEGLADKRVWRRAYDEINAFEKMLTDDGVRIVKLFLHITRDEQLRRFAERLGNPYKRWKLTAADLRAHERWDDYVDAAHDMLDRTSTAHAPWTAIAGNQKWYGRVEALRCIVGALARGMKLKPPPIDPKLSKAALRQLARIEKKERRSKGKR